MKIKELEYNATGIVTAVNTNLRTLSFLKIVKQNGKEQNVKHSKLHQTRGDMKKDLLCRISNFTLSALYSLLNDTKDWHVYISETI